MKNVVMNPQKGDVARSTTSQRTRERHVIDRKGNDIHYLPHSPSGGGRERICYLSTWQEWCIKNKVNANP